MVTVESVLRRLSMSEPVPGCGGLNFAARVRADGSDRLPAREERAEHEGASRTRVALAGTGVATVDDALRDAVLEFAVVDEGREARVGRLDFEEEDGRVEEEEEVNVRAVPQDAELCV